MSSIAEPKHYRQVLLDTVDGIFAVSIVPDGVELDDRQHIVNPKQAFLPNSAVVAVEQGKMPAGKIETIPNPLSASQEVEPEFSKGARAGVFMVKFSPSGNVFLHEMPSLGQIS